MELHKADQKQLASIEGTLQQLLPQVTATTPQDLDCNIAISLPNLASEFGGIAERTQIISSRKPFIASKEILYHKLHQQWFHSDCNGIYGSGEGTYEILVQAESTDSFVATRRENAEDRIYEPPNRYGKGDWKIATLQPDAARTLISKLAP